MSVSSRSPTVSGRRAPDSEAAVSNSAGAGLPTTTSGSRSSAVRSTATSEPLPGNGPRGLGSVRSVLVAIHRAPARTASAASARIAQPTSGPYPCTTATGPSANPSTGVSPASRTSARSASAPTTSTGEPAGSSRASMVADAPAEVRTSPTVAGTPMPESSAATSAARREALFVAYATATPSARNRSTASEAPAIGLSIR
jgi:hypothetical protein